MFKRKYRVVEYSPSTFFVEERLIPFFWLEVRLFDTLKQALAWIKSTKGFPKYHEVKN